MFQPKTDMPVRSFYDNSFTLLGLIASFEVLFMHCVRHFSLNVPDALTIPLSIFQGVPIFFGLSGFLIWHSLEQEDCAKRYFKKRFLRIYPELWVAVFLSAVALLYFIGSALKPDRFLLYLFSQATVLQFWSPSCVAGYGVGVPNGSLWTISIFVQFYILIWVVRKKLRRFSFVQWIVLLACAVCADSTIALAKDHLPSFVFTLLQQTLLPYSYLFLLGAFLCRFRKEISQRFLPHAFTLTILLAVTLLLVKLFALPELPTAGYGFFRSTLVVFFTLCFGYGIRCPWPKRDLSYGIYVYHMVFVNLFLALGWTKNVWLIPLTFICSSALSFLCQMLLSSFFKPARKQTPCAGQTKSH